MVNFDKFEKRVKETYGNQEFPFDEQNWENASKLIDASRRGKNRGGFFLLSAVALLCTTGLVYYFGFSDNAESLKKNNLAVNEITTDKEPVVKTETGSQSPVENPGTEEKNNETINSKQADEPVNTISDSKNNSSGSTTTSKNNASAALSKMKDPEKTAGESATQNLNTETKAEEKTNTNSPVNSNETKTSESKTNNNQKKPEQVKSGKKNNIPPVLGSNISSNNPSGVKTTPVGNSGNTNKLGDINNPTASIPTKKETTVTDSTSVVVNAEIKPVESIVTDSSQTIVQMPVDSFKFPPSLTGDGISYATNVKPVHNHKNFLFMEAGATYLLGWNGGSNTDADGFNLVAGLNFQHYFTNNISAQIGAQYSSIGNITHTSHTISTINYDFGIEKDVTSIKYQKLHYVVAPIKVAVKIGKDNIIGIGCNVAYLLNSQSKKEKYKTYSNDPNAIKNNLTSTKETGYLQGFNPIDVQTSAFYRRNIYKGLSVNAEFIFGLTDTKSNDFFKSNNFERTTGFKLTLCYDLFKK